MPPVRAQEFAARDLNMAPIVTTIGLAVLDLTFAVSQRTLERA
jgi:hypothetical protein